MNLIGKFDTEIIKENGDAEGNRAGQKGRQEFLARKTESRVSSLLFS